MNQITSIFTFDAGVPTSVVAIVNGKQYTADSSNGNWPAIVASIRSGDVAAFLKHIDTVRAFRNYCVGKVRIVGNEVWHGNTRLHGVVVDRIFDFMKNELPVEPIMRFIDKLFANPSSRAVNELYTFLEHENLPITSNGNFQAYKGLNSDFYSITAGKLTLLQGVANSKGQIFNGVGQTIECVRHEVNDNKDETCSYGLHAGSLEYARGFAQGKLVVVEINPADVVSIPSDCNGQKLRTCKYVVVSEYVEPLSSVYVATSAVKSQESEYEGSELQYAEGYDEGYADAEVGVDASDSDLTGPYWEGYRDGQGDFNTGW